MLSSALHNDLFLYVLSTSRTVQHTQYSLFSFGLVLFLSCEERLRGVQGWFGRERERERERERGESDRFNYTSERKRIRVRAIKVIENNGTPTKVKGFPLSFANPSAIFLISLATFMVPIIFIYTDHK